MKDLLTTREAAKEIGITDARVRQLIYEKVIPAIKIGNAHVIKRKDLKLFHKRPDGRGRPKGSKNKAA